MRKKGSFSYSDKSKKFDSERDSISINSNDSELDNN